MTASATHANRSPLNLSCPLVTWSQSKSECGVAANGPGGGFAPRPGP